MCEQRDILYLTNYKFKNGKKQNVYILILDVLKNNLICLVKTSAQQYVNDIDIKTGCIKKENSRTFYIPSSQIIGESNNNFPDHTFIYFNSTIKHKTFSEIRNNCSKVELKDKMLKKIFIDIIYCSIHSSYLKPSVLNRFENYLNQEY